MYPEILAINNLLVAFFVYYSCSMEVHCASTLDGRGGLVVGVIAEAERCGRDPSRPGWLFAFCYYAS